MASDEVVRKTVGRRYRFADIKLDVSNLRLTVGAKICRPPGADLNPVSTASITSAGMMLTSLV
jgi:hypothetical protein